MKNLSIGLYQDTYELCYNYNHLWLTVSSKQHIVFQPFFSSSSALKEPPHDVSTKPVTVSPGQHLRLPNCGEQKSLQSSTLNESKRPVGELNPAESQYPFVE
jgi:hypothetical protein